jgi:hypothetical protein
LFVLHVVRRSLVRGTPGRIGRYWGTYTEHTGAAICLDRAGGWTFKDALNPYGYFCCDWHDRSQPPPAVARELLSKADVLHFHDDGYPCHLGKYVDGKILVHHSHIGDLPKRMFQAVKYDARVKHACITNGYGRLFDHEERTRRGAPRFGRLGDILDIDHPIMKPDYDARQPAPLRVAYTFSNRAEGTAKINAKSPEATKRILKDISGVDMRWVNNVSFEQAMKEKRAAHVVLDEIFTPYTNLSLLEGAAVGACVLANFDEYTANELCAWTGAPRDSLPFVHVTPETVRGTIEALRDQPVEVLERGRAARAWMEKWHGTKRLLAKYVEFYKA